MNSATKKTAPGTEQSKKSGKRRCVDGLLLNHFQHAHGTGLGADAAGDALGGRTLALENDDLHGTGLCAFAAADAVLFIDHVNTGLGILGDGVMLTGLHALAALNADVGLCAGALRHDLDAAQILMKFLIKCLRTCPDTLQTGHTLKVFFNREFFHDKTNSFMYFEKYRFFLLHYKRYDGK